MLWICLLISTGAAGADEASPTFGGETGSPFQVAVNPATGQPLVVAVPVQPPAQAAK
jgi:hypothetical protein